MSERKRSVADGGYGVLLFVGAMCLAVFGAVVGSNASSVAGLVFAVLFLGATQLKDPDDV